MLVVCRNDRAERNFQVAGLKSSPPIRMLTATLRRLKEVGVFGAGVWSYYGEPTTLACPLQWCSSERLGSRDAPRRSGGR